MRASARAILVCLGVTSAVHAQYVTAFDDDGMVTVNGTRTFIVGSYYVGNNSTAKGPAPELYAEAAEAGFNLVLAGSTEAMDMAHAAGLMTWRPVGTLDLADREGSAAKLKEAVAAVKDHPSLAFLETVDEPAWTWMKPEQRIPAEALVEAYPIIKEIDPDHLLYTNHAPTNLVKTMQAYNAGTDIVAMDIYPVNPGGLKHQYALFEDGHQGDLNNLTIGQVGEYVDKMRRVTGPGRPLFMVLQGFAWEMLQEEGKRDPAKILYPTFAQHRFMAFQSVIKGANGIVYWGTYFTPQPSEAWSDLKKTVSEVAGLGAVLAQRSSGIAVTVDYHETGHSVDDGVQWIAKEYDGALYVFTCNADRYPCKATLAGLKGWAKAEVLHEERTIAVREGGITDEWDAFGVHIYKLTR
ncbi:MAG: hypothetical protein AMXMBFR84_34100 [Candidatus Hydrogenedentota bacterium]